MRPHVRQLSSETFTAPPELPSSRSTTFRHRSTKRKPQIGRSATDLLTTAKKAKSEYARAATRLSKYRPSDGVLSRASLLFLKRVTNQKVPRHRYSLLLTSADPEKKKKSNFKFSKKKNVGYTFFFILFS